MEIEKLKHTKSKKRPYEQFLVAFDEGEFEEIHEWLKSKKITKAKLVRHLIREFYKENK